MSRPSEHTHSHWKWRVLRAIVQLACTTRVTVTVESAGHGGQLLVSIWQELLSGLFYLPSQAMPGANSLMTADFISARPECWHQEP